jgi:hypothetical protein
MTARQDLRHWLQGSRFIAPLCCHNALELQASSKVSLGPSYHSFHMCDVSRWWKRGGLCCTPTSCLDAFNFQEIGCSRAASHETLPTQERLLAWA